MLLVYGLLGEGAVRLAPFGMDYMGRQLHWLLAQGAEAQVVKLPTNIEGYQGKKSSTGGFYPDGFIDGISDDGHLVVGSLRDDALTGLAVRWTCR